MFNSAEEMEQFAQMIAASMATALRQEHVGCEFCGNKERRRAHREDHEFVKLCRRGWEAFTNFNWDMLKTIVKWATLGIIATLVLFFWQHVVDPKAPSVMNKEQVQQQVK